MFQRISNSWQLVKASAGVLRADKELIVFPIVSFIALLIVTASFAVPTVLAGVFDSATSGNDGIPVAGYVIGFLFYLVQYFVIFFANSALVGAAMIRLRGGDPTVSDGFRIATQRVNKIFIYALISATVGMVLQILSERAGKIGEIVASIIGIGWGLATYLVVPVLVVEDVGPIDSVKRSTELLKRTWGEQVVGNFGIGTIFGLLMVGTVLLGIPLIILAVSTESLALILLAIGLIIIVIATLALLNATLSGIYAAALYRYAADGNTSGYFEQDLIANAFRQK